MHIHLFLLVVGILILLMSAVLLWYVSRPDPQIEKDREATIDAANQFGTLGMAPTSSMMRTLEADAATFTDKIVCVGGMLCGIILIIFAFV